MVSVAHALESRPNLGRPSWKCAYPLLAWDANLPFKEVHRAIRGLGRFGVETLTKAVPQFECKHMVRIYTYERVVLSPLLPFLSQTCSADSGHCSSYMGRGNYDL